MHSTPSSSLPSHFPCALPFRLGRHFWLDALQFIHFSLTCSLRALLPCQYPPCIPMPRPFPCITLLRACHQPLHREVTFPFSPLPSPIVTPNSLLLLDLAKPIQSFWFILFFPPTKWFATLFFFFYFWGTAEQAAAFQWPHKSKPKPVPCASAEPYIKSHDEQRQLMSKPISVTPSDSDEKRSKALAASRQRTPQPRAP